MTTHFAIPHEKFIPLFEANRAPVLIDGSRAKFDVMTRQIVDANGIPIPPDRIRDAGHFRKRYYVYYGGRGGAKSHQFATALIIRTRAAKIKALCCREVQSTIADSVLSLLQQKIQTLGLEDDYEVLVNAIRCKPTGSTIAFRGLRHNTREIKSFEDADIAWVEEAADVQEESWDVLDPTIRKEGSEIWVGFNTELETDPTYVRFITNRDDDMEVIKVGYEDNPLISQAMLKQAMKMKEANPEKYDWIWAGNPRRSRQGGVFTSASLVTIDVAQTGTRWVRGWDLAGTEVDPKKPDRDPDYTVGVLLGVQPNGRYVIGAPVRMRGKPDDVERTLLTTVANEGLAIEHSVPQDPGSAGKFQTSYLAKRLAGYRIHFSPESGSKITRAEPFASQVNAGNVDILRGDWNRTLMDELESFPNGLHDDLVDGCSRAFSRLSIQAKYQTVRIVGL